ncbi:hypothetical protein G7046_g7951 [Stylonectria norvegica]|nr:hypothetical protein G7046_g7951 [Stylonectria norvegica]
MEETPTTCGYLHEGPFDSGWLRADAIHTLHYEQYGSRSGLPVLFLHGGPGGETSHANTQFFNPNIYRVILFDQRGCGQSSPRNEIRENTSHQLVADIEKLREHLKVPQWHLVFGGSWGTTLGLLYTETYPERVKSIILRGVTTMRKHELAHSRNGAEAAGKYVPEMYDKFTGFLSVEERDDPIAAYYKRLTSDDEVAVASAAKEWNRWALSLLSLKRGPDDYNELQDTEGCLTHAKLEAHYFVHGCWLEEDQLLKNIDRIKHIPGAIVSGRFDLITPPQTAWELHKLWPKSSIHFIEDAGHDATGPGTFSKLIELCDTFSRL